METTRDQDKITCKSFLLKILSYSHRSVLDGKDRSGVLSILVPAQLIPIQPFSSRNLEDYDTIVTIQWRSVQILNILSENSVYVRK